MQKAQGPGVCKLPHSSVLAWRIPGMGEPGGLLSLGSHSFPGENARSWEALGEARQARAASRRGSALSRLGAELELRRSGSSLGREALAVCTPPAPEPSAKRPGS